MITERRDQLHLSSSIFFIRNRLACPMIAHLIIKYQMVFWLMHCRLWRSIFTKGDHWCLDWFSKPVHKAQGRTMMRSKNLSRRQTRLHASFHPIPSSPLEFMLVITKNIITDYLLRIRLSSSILLLLPPHSSSSSSLDVSSSSLKNIFTGFDTHTHVT